jgi:hypothetical protein
MLELCWQTADECKQTKHQAWIEANRNQFPDKRKTHVITDFNGAYYNAKMLQAECKHGG